MGENRTTPAGGAAADVNKAAGTEARDDVPRLQGAPPQDLALVARLRGGDEAAFTALVEQYHGVLLRLALVFVSNRAVAEEVVQETWLGVLNGLDSFEGRSTLKAWICRILTNRAKTRALREGRYVPLASMEDAEWESKRSAVDPERFQRDGKWAVPPRQWEELTPERLAVQKEALRRLERAIEELPPNQRAVLILRDLGGIESTEVCNILEISETNQRVLLHRARSKLRTVLEAYVDRK